MLTRSLRKTVEQRLRQMPGLVLLGPRQVGKTTLAKSIAARRGKQGATYLDLERPADRRRLEDADAFLRAQTGTLVVIDEIHRAPLLFETLRGNIAPKMERKSICSSSAAAIEMAIEIKRSTAPVLSRGFHLACEVLKPKQIYLLRSGSDVWPYSPKITAITLVELMRKLAAR